MKFVFVGGGTGGHFYPLIAVAEELNNQIEKEKIVGARMYFISDDPYDKQLVFENGLEFIKLDSGKLRTYFSIKNFFDVFKTAFATFKAIFILWSIYPDVVFSKGGYLSFPVVTAARLLRIPVFIHESDASAGRVNKYSAKFAQRIAVSFPEAMEYFPKEKTAVTGLPMRRGVVKPVGVGAYEFLKLKSDIPTILIVGGSQGSEIINDEILDALPMLLQKYQIIHQCGVKNISSMETRSKIVLENLPEEIRDRYKLFGYLNTVALSMASGVSKVVISRAGSMIFEIASWGIPSILIPITNSNADHQRKNAYSLARAGGAIVIEENNLSPAVISTEIDRVIENPELWQKMSTSARAFSPLDAGEKIAQELLAIGISHEK